jgi:hypothetical protein
VFQVTPPSEVAATAAGAFVSVLAELMLPTRTHVVVELQRAPMIWPICEVDGVPAVWLQEPPVAEPFSRKAPGTVVFPAARQ